MQAATATRSLSRHMMRNREQYLGSDFRVESVCCPGTFQGGVVDIACTCAHKPELECAVRVRH